MANLGFGSAFTSEPDLRVICHVCGKIHERAPGFYSTMFYIQAEPDGPAFPIHTCGAHPREEVAAAFDCLNSGKPLPWRSDAPR